MQNINLYQPEKQHFLARPSMPVVLLLGGLLLLFSLLDAGWHGWRLWQQVKLLQASEARAQTSEQTLAAATAAFQAPEPDPDLPGKIQALQAENQQLHWLSRYLDQLRREQGRGFSHLLDGLSAQHLGGVWLQGFRFEQGGRQLYLQGAVSQPGLLPEYLASLGRNPAFNGRSFAAFALERDQAGSLLFRLSSAAEEPQETSR